MVLKSFRGTVSKVSHRLVQIRVRVDCHGNMGQSMVIKVLLTVSIESTVVLLPLTNYIWWVVRNTCLSKRSSSHPCIHCWVSKSRILKGNQSLDVFTYSVRLSSCLEGQGFLVSYINRIHGSRLLC